MWYGETHSYPSIEVLDPAGNGGFQTVCTVPNAIYWPMTIDATNQYLYFTTVPDNADIYRVNLDGTDLTKVLTVNLENIHTIALARNVPDTSNQNPVADAGENQTLAATGALTEVSLVGSGSSDPDGDVIAYEWSVPAGSGAVLDDPSVATPTGLFPVGPTLVTLTVTDGRGGVATADVLVTIEDATAPVVVCTTDRSMLWPADHSIVEVAVYVQASDDVVSGNQLQITASVKSSEPDDATGDGRFPGDVNGEDAFRAPVPVDLTFDDDLWCFVGTVLLRAERDGNQGSRTYSIVCEGTDSTGNKTPASCLVVVPHDRRKK